MDLIKYPLQQYDFVKPSASLIYLIPIGAANTETFRSLRAIPVSDDMRENVSNKPQQHGKMSIANAVQQLQAEWVTQENFQRFGQLILPNKDGKAYDLEDAQLNLQNGIPRFYIMRLQRRGRKFHTITRHTKCTQCLGSLEGKDWLIAVAPPNNNIDIPAIEEIKAFQIPGNCFIKLEMGTWHAGPYFEHEAVDFYNLELADTNVVDHLTHNFLKSDRLEFEIV